MLCACWHCRRPGTSLSPPRLGASCLGPLAGQEKQKALYAATVAHLSSQDDTNVILMARADTTSLREAIKPDARVISQSLLASGTRHPILCQGGGCEVPFIRRVADDLSALIPWLADAPVGETGLGHLVGN